MSIQVVVSHATGNSNVRAVIASLLKNNMLSEFQTTIGLSRDSNFLKLLPLGLSKEMMRRTYSIPRHKIVTHPWRDLSRMLLPKIGLQGLAAHEHKFASIDAVYQQLDNLTAKRLQRLSLSKQVHAVYSYEDGALATFEKAKKLGLKCIYDLPIAYWETGRKLMIEEALRYPEWAVTLGGGIMDSEKKLERKTRELKLADLVVVPGSFVNDSLPPWAKDKAVHIAPFGSPELPISEGRITHDDQVNAGRLRVLFVGSMGQRKGLADLFAAMRLINNPNVELVVMGSLMAPIEFYKKHFPHFIYEAGRPHSQVLELMRTCDVFCLPSIVEGRALVMQEAMSQGLPLIITPNTGGEDLIIEGETGFIVPIRSPESIASKISWFLANRKKIPAMGKSAKVHAAEYTWAAYGDGITNAIKNLQV